MKAILVLNCGSSSVKFAVITPKDKQNHLSGLAENLLNPEAQITIKYQSKKETAKIPNDDHEKALSHAVKLIQEKLPQTIKIVAIGHRVTHGGELFKSSCLIDDHVLLGIKECASLAPLHNPANLKGIHAGIKAFPDLPQVAVFDTAFHQTLPEKAYLYATDYALYEAYQLRRYGFHGSSFRYICDTLPQFLDDSQQKKVIICHLGNGSSVCAVDHNQSIETSMGLTPLEGLVHGTRSGDIDPSALSFIASKTNKTLDEVSETLWKESGLLGLSKITNNCRILEEKAIEGDKASIRALDVYIHRLTKYIGAYTAILNGLDALIFTGGMGENSPYIRAHVCQNLAYLNININDNKNNETIRGASGNIAANDSLPVFVILTNEELVIAKDSFALIS